MGEDQVMPGAHQGRTLPGRAFAPGRQRLLGRRDGALRLVLAGRRDVCQYVASGGVADFEGLLAIGLAPFAVDQALGLQ